MTALLDLPAVRQQMHLMSVEEYHRAGETGVLSDDVELLRGIVVTKMPESPLHELVAGKMTELLLRQVPEEFKVRRESPLTLRGSEPEPDISVVKGRWDEWANTHPQTAHLVIEVAVTSEAIAESKAEIYSEAGIAEYWLVRPGERTVNVYREPGRDGYLSRSILGEHDRLRCASIPGVEFPLVDILPAH